MKTFLPLVLGALSFFSTTPAVVGAVVCFPDRATLLTAIADISDDGVGYTYVDAGGNNYGLIQDWCFASTLTDFSFLFASKIYFNAPIGGWDVSQVTDINECTGVDCTKNGPGSGALHPPARLALDFF